MEGGGGGCTIYVPMSTEGSGTPTTRPKTGYPGSRGGKGERVLLLRRMSEWLKTNKKSLICLLKPKVEVICEQFRWTAKIMSVRLFRKIK